MVTRISNITLLFSLFFSLQYSIRCMQEESSQEAPQYTTPLTYEPSQEDKMNGALTSNMVVPASASIDKVKALIQNIWGIDPIEQKIIGSKKLEQSIEEFPYVHKIIFIKKVLANNAEAGKYDSLSLEKQSEKVDVYIEMIPEKSAISACSLSHCLRSVTVGALKQQIKKEFQISVKNQKVSGYIGGTNPKRKDLKDYEQLYRFGSVFVDRNDIFLTNNIPNTTVSENAELQEFEFEAPSVRKLTEEE